MIKMIKLFFISLLSAVSLSVCSGNQPETKDDIFKFSHSGLLSTDKARYGQGETVIFNFDKNIPAGSMVRYRHLDKIIEEKPITEKTWTWIPPSTDFKGYLVELYTILDGNEKIIGSVGVDVSSDWTRFPRYGFISKYNTMSESEINAIIENLNKFHINGLQFYDWLSDHHKPLAGTPENPSESWLDIGGRTNTSATIKTYIAAAKKHNIASMWYDLCYGALQNALADGVQEEWYMFKDANGASKVGIQLSEPFRSNIYLVNPNNAGWLDYFSNQVKDVYSVYDFDGFHIDQLGNQGTVFDYNGSQINLPDGFEAFIQRMKSDFPHKRHAFNAVSGYGQHKIAISGVDFIYNEIWSEEPNYADLKTIIDINYSINNNLNCVFAAYLNYNLGNKMGMFNTPGVLMADAIMFALGASHIELGEHMLTHEYFPNDNLSMDKTLETNLIRYYDFLVAYQNILRDGGEFNEVFVSSTNNSAQVQSWTPALGKIVTLSKKVGNKQIIHLFNFVNAKHLQWRDPDGTQPEPRLQQNIDLQINMSQNVSKVWTATPDPEGKMYEEIDFSVGTGNITLTIPTLKYWTMLVIE